MRFREGDTEKWEFKPLHKSKNITLAPGYSLADLHNAIKKEFNFSDRFTHKTDIRILRLKMLGKDGQWEAKDVNPSTFDEEMKARLAESPRRNEFVDTIYLGFGIRMNKTNNMN
jgi:hypothetical protein